MKIEISSTQTQHTQNKTITKCACHVTNYAVKFRIVSGFGIFHWFGERAIVGRKHWQPIRLNSWDSCEIETAERHCRNYRQHCLAEPVINGWLSEVGTMRDLKNRPRDLQVIYRKFTYALLSPTVHVHLFTFLIAGSHVTCVTWLKYGCQGQVSGNF